jgi:hypothetical protein
MVYLENKNQNPITIVKAPVYIEHNRNYKKTKKEKGRFIKRNIKRIFREKTAVIGH